jgi:hypothetical protein
MCNIPNPSDPRNLSRYRRKRPFVARKCLLSTCWNMRTPHWVAFCSEAHLNTYVNNAFAGARMPKGVGTAFVDGRVVVCK